MELLNENPYFQSDPALRAQAIIDPTKIDPVAQKYIAAGLIPSSASGSIAPVGAQLEPFNQYNGRFDFVLSDKDRLAITLARSSGSTLSPFAGGATGVNSDDRFQPRLHLEHWLYPHVLAQTWSTEARMVVQRLNSTNAIPVGSAPTPADLGIGVTPDQSTGPTRLYDYSTGLTVGFSPQGPTSLINNTFGLLRQS